MSDSTDVFQEPEKKVFFLNPSAVIMNKIIPELVQQEYEVYSIKDRETLKRALKKYKNCVLFIDINEDMSEKEWEVWITAVMKSPETKGISIGIITSNDDELIKRKYLLSVKVPCGYTVLKYDLDKAITHIFEVLQAVNAKGRRKFVRATMDRDANTTVNLPISGMFVKGRIVDISTAGFSCIFNGEDPEISRNILFRDIQIKLQSVILKVEGIVFGFRSDDTEKKIEKVYVFIFTQRVDPDTRSKIRKYIQQNLQNKMDAELK